MASSPHPAHVGARLALAIAAVAVAAAAAPAGASGWSKPRTLVVAAEPDGLGAGLAQSPDGTVTDAFTATDRGGIRLYPWRAASAFGAASDVPGSRRNEAYVLPPVASVAIADGGTTAVAWVHEVEEGDEEQECLCALRAAIRPRHGAFGAVQTVSPLARGEITSLQMVTGAGGSVTALWNVGSVERWAETSGTRFEEPRPAPRANSALLSTLAGRPEIYFLPEGGEPTEEEVFAGPLPLRSRRLLGRVPGQTVEPDGETLALAADPRGDVVVVGVEENLRIAYRVTGRRLGRPRRFARLGKANLCHVAAEMNARGEALVAWSCSTSRSYTGPGRAVLLSRGGRVLAASRGRTVAGLPAIALDPHGDALVAWALPTAHGTVFATQQRRRHGFGRDRPILRTRSVESIRDLSLAIAGRTGVALWTDRVPLPHRERQLERVRVASATLE